MQRRSAVISFLLILFNRVSCGFCVCVCVRARRDTYMRTYIHTYIHTYMYSPQRIYVPQQKCHQK
jgi:hypothetical protein